MAEVHPYILIAGFVLNLILIAVGGTWKLSRVEASINKTIFDHRREIDERIVELMQEFERRIVENERRYGETVAALRTKIHDVETWARDEFVRKGSFSLVAAEIKISVGDLGKEIKTRLERMEGKIDDASKEAHLKS